MKSHAVLFGEMLNKQWAKHSIKMDWAEMEQMLLAVLHSEQLTDTEKVSFCKETIDAFTKRGHFKREEYGEAR